MMKENEQVFWVWVWIAWLLSVITFWNRLTFTEGIVGSFAFLSGVIAVWDLYKIEGD